MRFPVRIIIPRNSKRLRHLVQSVPEKEIDMICYSCALCLINKESLRTVHVCAALDHSSNMTLNLSPAYLKNRILPCGCAKASLHSAFVKPYGHGTVAKGKALAGSTVLSL